MASHILRWESLAETEAFGRQLGSVLLPHLVIALDGPLGAGKTHLTKAIAEGLQVENPSLVNSPTFVLIQEYPAKLPIYHFDAYRLSGPAEFQALGAEEYFESGGVCLIEWAEKVESVLPADRLSIRLEILSPTARLVTITTAGPLSEAVFNTWQTLESPANGR